METILDGAVAHKEHGEDFPIDKETGMCQMCLDNFQAYAKSVSAKEKIMNSEGKIYRLVF